MFVPCFVRTFRREITTDKLGITMAERTLALEIIQKMAYAKSATEYAVTPRPP